MKQGNVGDGSLDRSESLSDNQTDMPVSAGKIHLKRKAAQLRASRLRAAKKAEEAAKVLHSFAGSLIELDSLGTAASAPTPTPRNWWRLQSGRFKNDPTFASFVAQVQASRKQEG